MNSWESSRCSIGTTAQALGRSGGGGKDGVLGVAWQRRPWVKDFVGSMDIAYKSGFQLRRLDVPGTMLPVLCL